MADLKRNVILIARQFVSDEYWPGFLLAGFLFTELGEDTGRPVEVAITGGGTVVVVGFPEYGFDVLVACYGFVEYTSGFSCHVRLKRRLLNWRSWFSQKHAVAAQQSVCDAVDRALASGADIDVVGWFTDDQYKHGRS